MAFADRDFYYGDPRFSTQQPMKGLLSKDYAKQRASEMLWDKNNPTIGPGDPYPFEGKTNPFSELIKKRNTLIDSGLNKISSPVPVHDN
ncbi:hypothetical protein ABTM57_19490, partial [Acinetobacter baumannii]